MVGHADAHVEFVSQKDLLRGTPQNMRRWNNDYEAHEDLWTGPIP